MIDSFLPETPEDFTGMRATVMGLGAFGGGLGAARFLLERGAHVRITDVSGAEKLAQPLSQLRPFIESGAATLRLGGHDTADFTDADMIVVNPAVPKPWNNPYLQAAENAGVPITTEIGLLLDRLPDRSRIAAVTGTAGKSTTTALIAHILRTCGREVVVGGNIGGSLLEKVEEIRASRPFVVLELSSFMLHWINRPEGGWAPKVAVVTNLSDNHLDWHSDLAHYAGSKQRMLAHQQPGDAAVLGATVADWPTAPGVKRVLVGPGARLGGMLLPGEHNALNGAMAVQACLQLDPTLQRPQAEDAGRGFGGLAHRLQHLASVRGVTFINDSKSTTPEAARLAVASLPCGQGRIHLIAGGYDKKSDLSSLGAMGPGLAGLYTIGVTGPAIAAAAGGSAVQCGTLAEAFAAAVNRAKEGEAVLLSPGCASWDQFENFEKRGEAFADLVRAFAASCGAPLSAEATP